MKGGGEASELLASAKDGIFPPDNEKGSVSMSQKESTEKTGFPCGDGLFTTLGWEGYGVPVPENEEKIVPLCKVEYEYSLPRGGVELYRHEEEKKHKRMFNRMVMDEMLTRSELSLHSRATSARSSDWSVSGAILSDALKAIDILEAGGYSHEPVILVTRDVMRLLLRQSGDTGQTELELLKLIGHVKATPAIKGYSMIVYAPDSFMALVRKYPESEEIGETVDSRKYVMRAEFSPLLYDRKAAVSFQWKK